MLAFHGVGDNRIGVVSHSEILLRAGYDIILMDSRRHGASEGEMATYGWLERGDARAIVDVLVASLREASYDYAGLRWSPLLGKTLFAPFTWMLVSRRESLAGFSASGISPEKAVAERAFPVLLICDANDVALPCRHAQRIYAAALGPKSLWVVPEAFHTGALGFQPDEFRRRVLQFFANPAASQ